MKAVKSSGLDKTDVRCPHCGRTHVVDMTIRSSNILTCECNSMFYVLSNKSTILVSAAKRKVRASQMISNTPIIRRMSSVMRLNQRKA